MSEHRAPLKPLVYQHSSSYLIAIWGVYAIFRRTPTIISSWVAPNYELQYVATICYYMLLVWWANATERKIHFELLSSNITRGLLCLFGASLARLRSPRLDVVAAGGWHSTSIALVGGALTKTSHGQLVGCNWQKC